MQFISQSLPSKKQTISLKDTHDSLFRTTFGFHKIATTKNHQQSNRQHKSLTPSIYSKIKNKKKPYKVVFGKTISLIQQNSNLAKQQGNDIICQKKIDNPECYYLQQSPKYSAINTQGLCYFQYIKTIKGKIQNKSNHHLNFSKQASQKSKASKDQQQYNKPIRSARVQYKNINPFSNKCHKFNSYTDRKVFEPQQTVDKFYEKDKAIDSIKRSPNILVWMKKSPQRKFKKSLTCQLQYDKVIQAKQTILPNHPKYKLTKTDRKFQISKQIINLQRGCYR